MSYTCPNYIPCCPDFGPCVDNPPLTLPNFKPGHVPVPGHNYPADSTGNPQDTPPIGGGSWLDWTCYNQCTSEVSQEAAQLCANFQQENCNANPLPVPGNPANGGDLGSNPISGHPPIPPIQRFANTAQTCTLTCTGGSSSYTVSAGTFGAWTQILADRMAYSYACYKASQDLICLNHFTTPPWNNLNGTRIRPVTVSDFEGSCCGGRNAIFIIQVGGRGPFDWAITSGILPAGFSFSISADTRTMTIAGSTTAGTDETFTVQVQQRFTGVTVSREYNIRATGFTD